MTTISFTGDIAFSKYFADAWQRDDFIDDDILKFLNDSEYVVANVESPFTAAGIDSDRPLNHASNPAAISTLRKLNANIWTIGNNHVLDCGEEGMLDTIKLANDNGFQTVGAGRNADEAIRPIIINQDGGIGIFVVTYKRGEFIRAGENSPGCILFEDTRRILQMIRTIKQKCRWCIVIAHGGEEFSSMPLPSIRKRYIDFLDYGADIVVGHHPHVMQNYETFGNKTIFYSLGNFIFDTNYQRIQSYTEYGMLIKLCFSEKEYSWEKMPILIDRKTQTIVPCENPDIFCNIGKREYNLLKPLIVKTFFINNKKARCFSEPEKKNNTFFDWFRHYAGRFGSWAVVCMHLSEQLYPLKRWMRANEKLYDYLLKSVKEEAKDANE